MCGFWDIIKFENYDVLTFAAAVAVVAAAAAVFGKPFNSSCACCWQWHIWHIWSWKKGCGIIVLTINDNQNANVNVRVHVPWKVKRSQLISMCNVHIPYMLYIAVVVVVVVVVVYGWHHTHLNNNDLLLVLKCSTRIQIGYQINRRKGISQRNAISYILIGLCMHIYIYIYM